MLKKNRSSLCGVSMKDIVTFYADGTREFDEKIEDVLLSFGSRVSSDYYNHYGVDNDFDLAEAMYGDYSSCTGNLIREPWFVDFRIKCALNPEYTEKCLESEAFQDVRDEILERLKQV